MVAITPPNHPYVQNKLNDLDFCECGVAKRLHKNNQPLMETDTTSEVEEKFWNSKPKKIVTGKGVVVYFSKKEFDELLSTYHHQLQKAREEERAKVKTMVQEIGGQMYFDHEKLREYIKDHSTN